MPTPAQLEEYDISVWITDQGAVMMAAGTREGVEHLRTMDPIYELGDTAEVHHNDPEEFLSQIPKSLRVGLLCPVTKKIRKYVRGPLH